MIVADPFPAHDCRLTLVFRGTLGAPGYGQSWECSICGEGYHRTSADSTPHRFADLDPSAFILDPADCI